MGYENIMVDNVRHKSHRLAWFYMHGEWPPHQVDHINRVRGDNRIANLRLATRAENLQNRNLSKNNTSGHEGVKWNGRVGKWYAQISHNKERMHLGSYSNIEDAIAARSAARLKLHKFAQLPILACPAASLVV
jgi:hypothetical protein